MKNLAIVSLALLPLAAVPAAAQVYPDRIVEKVKHAVATTAYQRRARDDNREEQTERTTKTFRLGANGSLSLANISGDITVTRGNGSETTVEIVKTARGRDVNDARELLQLVTVDAVERNGRADVKTRYPSGDEARRNNRRNINVNVTYNVTMPAGTGISVESISGDIKVSDVKGDVVLHTISGDVTLRRVSAERIEINAVSGGLTMEDVQSERVQASTTSGDITYSGMLARNGHYSLKGFSGDVRVRLTGTTGFDVDASTFSGDINSRDFPLTSRGRVGRKTLSGTYGDGSAVLELRTFSGSIVISKK